MFDQGSNILAAAGFFNPMLGSGESAVSVGGGGGGTSGPFELADGKVTRCGLLFGRRWLTCEDTAIGNLGTATGVIYATVAHPDEAGKEPVLSVRRGASLPESSADATHRLLYRADSAGDWTDMRFAPLVMSMD